MGKSKRHSPFIGWCKSNSEKKDKQHANRKTRRSFKMELTTAYDYDDLIQDKTNRDYSDINSFSKDGMHRISNESNLFKKTYEKII